MTAIAQSAPAPAVFDFHSHKVRIVMKDGEPWFVAKDVCDTLGYANSRKAVGDHLDADEKGVTSSDTLGGQQQMQIINESGLYALVLRSRKPEARKFAKWVTSEVLPAIRKTGSYSTAPAFDPTLIHRALDVASTVSGRVQSAVFDAVMRGNTDWDMERWMFGFTNEKAPYAHMIPRDAAVMTQGQYLRAMTEGNGLYVSTPDLSQFIEAATRKLARRCTFYEGQAAGKAVELQS